MTQLPVKSKPLINCTSLWTKFAYKKHHFNRLDPESDKEEDETNAGVPIIKKPKDGKVKLVYTKDDWKEFWVQRLRKLQPAPNLSDKDIFDIVERNKRLYFQKKKEESQPHIDADLPSCYYWDKFQVAEWVTNEGLPDSVKSMLLSSGISGRHLITLEANTLLKLGLYNLDMIKAVTKAVRKVLGLPQTNGLRAIARFVALERFLKIKVRTGPTTEKLTFKEFCENEGIEYEPARRMMIQGYSNLPENCKVVIKPSKREKVQWIPVHRTKPKGKMDRDMSDSNESTSSSDDTDLDIAPTVEYLADNALIRNAVIPEILNHIIDTVFESISQNRINQKDLKNRESLDVLNQAIEIAFKSKIEQTYSDFSIEDPEDKLKLVTNIAEHLADEILRAREILKDIDQLQTNIQQTMSLSEINILKQSIADYLFNIMPTMVSKVMAELEHRSLILKAKLESKNPRSTEATYLLKPKWKDNRDFSEINVKSR